VAGELANEAVHVFAGNLTLDVAAEAVDAFGELKANSRSSAELQDFLAATAFPEPASQAHGNGLGGGAFRLAFGGGFHTPSEVA
jgi:hypothetical protein